MPAARVRASPLPRPPPPAGLSFALSAHASCELATTVMNTRGSADLSTQLPSHARVPHGPRTHAVTALAVAPAPAAPLANPVPVLHARVPGMRKFLMSQLTRLHDLNLSAL